MISSHHHRTAFSTSDLALGKQLWTAYKKNNLVELKRLSDAQSTCFPYLKEVIQAHIERFDKISRPEKVIREIMQTSPQTFHSVFKEFSKREGVYGFGDMQLKQIYHRIITS